MGVLLVTIGVLLVTIDALLVTIDALLSAIDALLSAIGVLLVTIGTKFCARDALSTAMGGGGLAVGMGSLFGEALEAGQSFREKRGQTKPA